MSHERPGTVGTEYWDAVVSRAPSDRPQPLWRTHSDTVNVALCRRWWPASGVGRLLKTDLFDEVHGGGLTPFLITRAGMVQGIDCSVEVVRRASGREASLRTAVADVRRLPFAGGAFDLVVSNSTLDHFERHEDIAASLREIHRVLVPGGRLILTLDNLANPVVALRNALPFRLTHALGLVPYYVGATCGPWRGARMATDAGFHVLDQTAVMHCPRVLAVGGAGFVERRGGERARRALLRMVAAFEGLARWPTRYQTGYFIALLAQKPPGP